jgi:hypothetical protein
MNRRLETTDELVSRANARYLNSNKEDESQGFMNTESAIQLPSITSGVEEIRDTTLEKTFKMEKFYEQYNKVLLDKMQLESQKRELLDESNSLRSLLKQYLDGISVNDSVLKQKNSLFMVNGEVNVR